MSGPDERVVDEPELVRSYSAPAVAPEPRDPYRRSSHHDPDLRPSLHDPYLRPTPADVLPRTVTGAQQRFTPSPPQWDNARVIVSVARDRGLPVYAAVIALATALQESLLENLTEAVDNDSLGLFQQRPSSGWGIPDELTDPAYAAGAFLDGLVARAPDFRELPLWESAQATQASAHPQAYAQWEEQAAAMVDEICGE
ncbi:hypothetical protein BJY24_007475 [Nocardia transvalensis]|uniref:Uncharacterized protein n=1 Tax=Nocardia transvalensis TaxID=37333 RepID=A0A7W9PN39_9NOCA|nr:hypothetical protein [Nocardia transvalensis]MBB5918563.1 hypothetical protein [Nocardia transvalensis]